MTHRRKSLFLATALTVVGLAVIAWWIFSAPADDPSLPPAAPADTADEVSADQSDIQRLLARWEETYLLPDSGTPDMAGPDDSSGIAQVIGTTEGIAGQIIEPDGTPVVEARVTLSDDHRVYVRHTDEEGRFHLPGLTSGRWTAVANSPHHDPSPPTPMRPGDEIAIEIVPGGIIFGRVRDHRLRPVEDFSVLVSPLEVRGDDHYHPRHIRTGHTSERPGHFEIAPIPSGRHRLDFHAPDLPVATVEPVEVTAGERTGPLDIRFDAPAALVGHVYDAETDEPIGGATVEYIASGDDSTTATSDEAGSFRLAPLPAGPQSIRISHQDYVTELRDAVQMPRGGELTYDVGLQPVGDGPGGFARFDTGLAVGPGERGVRIFAVQPGSPADEVDIEPDDEILAIDDLEVEDLSLDDVVRLLRGDDESPVELTVHRAGRGARPVVVYRQRIFVARE